MDHWCAFLHHSSSGNSQGFSAPECHIHGRCSSGNVALPSPCSLSQMSHHQSVMQCPVTNSCQFRDELWKMRWIIIIKFQIRYIFTEGCDHVNLWKIFIPIKLFKKLCTCHFFSHLPWSTFQLFPQRCQQPQRSGHPCRIEGWKCPSLPSLWTVHVPLQQCNS